YTTGTTLTLTTLTTCVGFGSLVFASHKGLASFGALMAIGTATCWFSCVIVLPALLKLFGMSRNGHRYSIDSAG
ncbi:MMPL family transporter, partial [bacterium]|nr:MMPL family transporter [bacterium]